MNNQQLARLTYLCEHIENDIQNLKDELLIAMIQEQEKLLELKYDRKDYHKFPIKWLNLRFTTNYVS